MSSKIFQLHKQATAEFTGQANEVERFLASQGFESKDIDDLVYVLAERLSNEYRDEVGATTAQRLAQAEYNAAEELNQISMNQQLLVLRCASKDLKSFKAMLEEHLKLTLPELTVCA